MTRKTYCGNLLWQSSLTLLVPGDVILPGLKGKIAKMTLLRTGEEVPCIDQWGFELLKKDDQRIRPKGIVPGDVVKIVLSKE